MHGFLAQRTRLAIFWAALLALGLTLAGLLRAVLDVSWTDAAVIFTAGAAAIGNLSLSARYVARAVPLESGATWRQLGSIGTGAVLSALVALALCRLWVGAIDAIFDAKTLIESFRRSIPVLFATGVFSYVLATAWAYLGLEYERASAAEQRTLEQQMLASEAELRALRAQINPHFLFNSLNSISALTSIDAAGARRMCVLLGDYLRHNLKLGGEQAIPLREELRLIEQYLAIEQVRFGRRLQTRVQMDPAYAECEVPPLILQPLVENAVKHGIASLVEGGTISVAVDRRADRVTIAVSNAFDASASSTRGAGVGLANVRRRLATRYGRDAELAVSNSDGTFSVTLSLPCHEASREAAAGVPTS